MDASKEPEAADRGCVTQLLFRAQTGDAGASDELMPLVYAELQALARGIFSAQRVGHTLQPTALVHEAFMKLAGHLGEVEGKRHFLVLSGRAMRQIITDHARCKGAEKRGGGKRVTLNLDVDAGVESSVDLVALDDSLRSLSELNPRGGRGRRATALQRPHDRGDGRGTRDVEARGRSRVGPRPRVPANGP